MENQHTPLHDCCCSEACCAPKKKNSFLSKLIFLLIVLAAGAIITVKLVCMETSPPEKCCDHPEHTNSCSHSQPEE